MILYNTNSENYFFHRQYTWFGNRILCNTPSINRDYKTQDDVGIFFDKNEYPVYWNIPEFKYYKIASVFIRKYRGKIEGCGYNEYRNISTIQLFESTDSIFNFKDFDWIQIFNSDVSPTKHMLKNIKFPVFSTSYFNFNNKEECQLKNIELFVDIKNNFANEEMSVIPTFNFNDFLDCKYETIFSFKESRGRNSYGKQKKVGWKGSNTCDSRIKLTRISKEYPDLIDSKLWVLYDKNVPQDLKDFTYTTYISIQEQIDTFDYLIDVGAAGFSGRLTNLINSNRILFLTDNLWHSYVDSFLKPNYHYVPIRNDLNDLIEKIKNVNSNYDKFNFIRDNLYNLSEMHFSPYIIKKNLYEIVCKRLNLN